MRSRLFPVLSFLIIASWLLAACTPVGAPSAPSSDDQPAAESSGERIELLYMTHNHAQSLPVNEAIIAEFEESHPNVDIVFDNSPHDNYEQKVLTAFAGGQGPDVFWMGDWMVPQLLASGVIAEVDPTAFGVQTPEEFLELYEPGSLDAFSAEGKVYTGGISEYNTFSLIYNVDAFAEAGIDLLSTEEPITWEEFADIAARLSKTEDGVVTRTGVAWPFQTPIWTVLILEPMLRQLGGELVNPETGLPDFTQEAMVATMNYVQGLRQSGAVDPAVYTGLLEDFANGRTAAIFGGPWAAKPLNDMNPDLNWAVAPLPQFANAQERITTLYAWAWFVSAQATPEEQKVAWEFVNLLTSKQQIWWDQVGYVQARVGTADNGMPLQEYYATADERLNTIFADYPYGKYEFRSEQYFELSDIWTRALDRVLNGEDVMTVLNDAQAQAQAAVE
jgi:multiple sugar transport system substrate-binding protein